MRYVAPELPIHTFSYIDANNHISEEYWVDKVNENVKAISHKVSIDESDILTDMDNIISLQGEPFGSTSIYAQYRIYQEAKKAGIKVILDGQGADELLAGYSGYPAERLKSLWEMGKVMDILVFLFHWAKWPDRGVKAAMTQLLGLLVPQKLKKIAHQWHGKNIKPIWLNTDFLVRKGVHFIMPGIAKRSPENRGRRVPETLRHLFLHGNLISLLRHADRNSMHWSVESRVPFLTIPMAQFLLSLPESFLIDQKGRTKSVFREAMRGIVPDEILDRKDKIGFATPEKDWLLSEELNLRARLSCLFDLPFIHKAGVDKYIDDLKRGKRKFDFTTWRLLNFSKWTERNMSVNQVNQKE
jgi:asparagine synthase (glutamine-hydrolysing)